MSAPLWDYLSAIKPYLWDAGKTYPSSISQSYSMLSNDQIDLSMTFGGAGIAPLIQNGQLPATAKVYCMNTSIANTNYVAIPYNANAKAAAMVVANILLEPQMQADFINLTGNGPSINVNTLTGSQAAIINNVMNSLPQGTYVPPERAGRNQGTRRKWIPSQLPTDPLGSEDQYRVSSP